MSTADTLQHCRCVQGVCLCGQRGEQCPVMRGAHRAQSTSPQLPMAQPCWKPQARGYCSSEKWKLPHLSSSHSPIPKLLCDSEDRKGRRHSSLCSPCLHVSARARTSHNGSHGPGGRYPKCLGDQHRGQRPLHANLFLKLQNQLNWTRATTLPPATTWPLCLFTFP